MLRLFRKSHATYSKVFDTLGLGVAMYDAVTSVGDLRPLSNCQFSLGGERLVTSGWSGIVRIWSFPLRCGGR